MSEKKWMSVAEAGIFFGLRKKNLYTLIARRQLPAGVVVVRFGKLIRISVEGIEASGRLGEGKQGRRA